MNIEHKGIDKNHEASNSNSDDNKQYNKSPYLLEGLLNLAGAIGLPAVTYYGESFSGHNLEIRTDLVILLSAVSLCSAYHNIENFLSQGKR